MRCWRVAGGLGRPGFLVLSVLAVSAIVMMTPVSARPHAHGHHYHFAWRHAVPLQAPSVAASSFGFQPFGWQQSWQQQQIPGNTRTTARRRIAGNGWTANGWSPNWQANGWSQPGAFGGYSQIDGMASAQASAAGVPISLVDRVIKRESGGNPRAVSRGNYGLMQIRLGTARAMGYTGSAAGLLDPQTNMTYAVRYLAGAYRAAGGNESRAVALYARGYYDVAKSQGFSPYGSSFGGGSYTVASNNFGGGVYQPAQWQNGLYGGEPRLHARHFRHRPV